MEKKIKNIKMPKGFVANGIHCGLKNKRKDLSVFYSKKVCKASAMFTTNAVKAAPVVLAMEQLEKSCYVNAVVVNSGNANCMTGKRGMSDARRTVKSAAKILGVSEDKVLVSSTGIIGEFMQMQPLLGGLEELVSGMSAKGLADAAEGIMTTDKFPKISSRSFLIGSRKVTITGVAKGAGMIKPDMATMLSYIMTDANIAKSAMDKALAENVAGSFNAITVDGDMSTNDTAVLLANGEAGNRKIDLKGRDFKTFCRNLDAVSADLAKMIVMDGEGATKFIEVHVKGAKTVSDASKVAGAIAGSLLVKCAVLGGDPNWGRIASSAGSSGAHIDPDKMEIILDGVTFFKGGRFMAHVNRRKSSVFKKDEVNIKVNLHLGKKEAKKFSCDISKKYITLNSYYTT